jgi:hypothetical protein
MSATSSVVGGVVSGWVAGSYDDVTLLIPLEDAGARTDADELEPSAPDGLELGMLRWQDELWPAYRLDRELAPVAWELTSSAMVLPVYANGQTRGIVCDQIRSFEHPIAVSLHPIPGCLRHRPSPVVALGLYETLRVGLVVRGDSIIRHLDAILEGGRQ